MGSCNFRIPSFNFGNNWYNELDEVFKIETIDDLE